MADETEPKIKETKETVVHPVAPHAAPHGTAPLIIAIGVAVLFAGIAGGFMAGWAFGHINAGGHYAMHAAGNGLRGPLNQSGMSGGVTHRKSFTNSVSGSVTAVSATSITVKATGGEVVTYAITSSTKVTHNDGTAATVNDIKVGDTVHVRQAAGQTGEAQSIRIGS